MDTPRSLPRLSSGRLEPMRDLRPGPTAGPRRPVAGSALAGCLLLAAPLPAQYIDYGSTPTGRARRPSPRHEVTLSGASPA